MSDISDLIGQSFRLVKMTEVYRSDTDGRYTATFGCFESEVLAKAYASQQADSAFVKTRNVFAFVDGPVAYFAGGEALLANSEGATEVVRRKALSKLTPEEIQVLGVGGS